MTAVVTAPPQMVASQEVRRILVVGSGRRIRNNFLPALATLGKPAEVVGVWSPTRDHALAAAAPWEVPVSATLAAGLAEADTVIVSVSTKAVPQVLAQLETKADRLRLVLDTPVFGSARHLLRLGRLQHFASVAVAEDYVQFPQWVLVRKAVDAGLAGPLRHVELRHSGFRYHGLALIRSLFGLPFARSMRRRSSGERIRYDFDFGRGRSGRIVEPYDQSRGTTFVIGERAVIVYRSGAADPELLPSDLPVLAIDFDDSGRVPAFTLSDLRLELPQLPALLDAPVLDRSVFNALKTCGLMTVLSALWSPPPAELRQARPDYDYHHALYDHLTTAALRQVPALVDPLATVRRNFVNVVERTVGLAVAVSQTPPATVSTSSAARRSNELDQ